ncbi:hypothetical protein [Streptomyces sp. NRRL F-2664]|uniref:hypothetical protein n=1 Tax=Streptomyces sp. NRRL F-2664 TaxID=1463842 RepID=UPI000A71EDD9|nr:hypothetical protein [Streptomyces sp. NRRL F-2664]
MSTRRTLGTGPTDPTTSTPTAPRLLPAERIEQEHQGVPVAPPAAESAPRSRRTLGQADRHRR